MSRYIGRTGLCAILSGMTGKEWRRIVGERLSLIIILSRVTICSVLHCYKGKYSQKVSRNWRRGANPNGYMVEEIWQELATARYLTWEHEATERSWNLQNLREACVAALKQKQFLDTSDTEGFVDENAKSNLDQLEALGSVFDEAAENDTPTELPDYLCCKITLDIFRDPVITPCGITYERAVILEHLLKVGKFDPITREPLYAYQLVPNLAIKEAVRAYLEKHGWAYKTD
ncbi:E3 ubiquitin-protein ligase CHIP-like isoform X2 [Primulina tabacum]|uniref:E3 ubiquitin-protein ligase CHIP-like isoform X2 n=1 Tax=Primulina tabacum TaxID=48773 RepID=UPI003F5AB33E